MGSVVIAGRVKFEVVGDLGLWEPKHAPPPPPPKKKTKTNKPKTKKKTKTKQKQNKKQQQQQKKKPEKTKKQTPKIKQNKKPTTTTTTKPTTTMSEDRLAHVSICWRRTPGSPETACRQRWMTGLAGEREPWGVD